MGHSSMRQILFTLLLLFTMLSCSPEQEKKEDPQTSAAPAAPETLLKKGCRGCHPVTLDGAHDFPCTTCHLGNMETGDKEAAHKGFIAAPSHPDHMAESCGQCHGEQVSDVAHSLHFSLKNEINLVRGAFGASEELQSLTDIPVSDPPQTLLDLTDDLLRRRCLRCHPYYSGDRYPAIVRGTGCASCHLHFYKGKLVSHSFLATPTDSQCLQCHYGNRVGFDYYGRYEHDMNDEYRTPYTTRGEYFRPYGVEFHQLSADIHQQRGMICVDCHSGTELMAPPGDLGIRCKDCHDMERITRSQGKVPLIKREKGYVLISAGDKGEHAVPLMEHPAHQQHKDVACQVCHAQWSFNDDQTSLLRSDVDEYDDFANLSVQGSFEVERIVKNNLDFNADELPHAMSDKITGESRYGIWYKGFVTRRWEGVRIGRDDSGVLQVMRPILDISLSWLNEDEEVVFDSFRSEAAENGLLPYTPHTTGRAGLFYRERIEAFLRAEHAEKQ